MDTVQVECEADRVIDSLDELVELLESGTVEEVPDSLEALLDLFDRPGDAFDVDTELDFTDGTPDRRVSLQPSERLRDLVAATRTFYRES